MYVAVKGGEKAIRAAHALQEQKRRGNGRLPELSVDQIGEQLNLAVDRVMTEGGIADRALQAADYDEEIAGPAQDEEFVLAHADNVEAAGFVSHLKLPHYVDFQAELALLKRLQRENERG